VSRGSTKMLSLCRQLQIIVCVGGIDFWRRSKELEALFWGDKEVQVERANCDWKGIP
jgi:uridylate kinase